MPLPNDIPTSARSVFVVIVVVAVYEILFGQLPCHMTHQAAIYQCFFTYVKPSKASYMDREIETEEEREWGREGMASVDR